MEDLSPQAAAQQRAGRSPMIAATCSRRFDAGTVVDRTVHRAE
jgi:hypothetical protein